MSTFELAAPPAATLRAEAARVLDALRGQLGPEAEVLEVGSTAIEGAIGKGDIDVLVRVPEARFEATRARLDELYPRNSNQLSNPQYQGYIVPSDLDVAIQLTVTGGPYDFFEAFMTALRDDPGLLEAYNALKRRWHRRPMDEYRAAKAAFIEAVLRGERPDT